MIDITEVDDAITAQLKILRQQITKNDLQFIAEFTLDKSSIKAIPFDDINYMGVYLIEIRNDKYKEGFINWLDKFADLWNDEEYEKKRTPRIINYRKQYHIDNNNSDEWIPLYIGKSRNIYKRIKEHIWMPLEKGTYALKLYERKNLSDSRFRISTIEVNVNNYNTIVPKVEAALRDDLKPIIGRQ